MQDEIRGKLSAAILKHSVYHDIKQPIASERSITSRNN